MFCINFFNEAIMKVYSLITQNLLLLQQFSKTMILMTKQTANRLVFLPTLSKFYEKLMQQQIIIKKSFTSLFCEYRKGYNTQQTLVSLINDKCFGQARLMILSKVLDTLNHKLFVSKLNANGFNKGLLKLINDYLSNRW